jgi:hypothetical protein
MDPTIAAALIAGIVSLISLGGTVAVGIAGFRNTQTATKITVEAGTANTVSALAAARSDKLWEQQRSAYHELSAYLLYIQAKRRIDMRTYRLSDQGEEALQRLLGSYKPANWWELQARIAHYGSDQVAALTFRLADLSQQSADASSSGNLAARPDIGEAQDTRERLTAARLRAEEIDQGLIKRMRAELNGTTSELDLQAGQKAASNA